MRKIINILLIFFSFVSFAQFSEIGAPEIRNYPPKSYGYESQNFSILTDNKGILYAGNLNGILIYDGTDWQLIDAQGGVSLTKTQNGDVYGISFRKFYHFINKGKNGILIDNISERQKEYFSGFVEKNNIYDIASVGNNVIVNTYTKLYLWKDDKFSILEFSPKGFNIFENNNNVYIFDKKGTLSILTKNGLIKFNEKLSKFKEKDIQFILPYSKDTLLFKPVNDKIYLITKSNILNFNSNINEFLSKIRIKSSTILKNKILLGTDRCGIIVLNKQNGEYICSISKENGLIGNLVNDVYIDTVNNSIWAALDNGVSRIDAPSAFTYMKEFSGLKGTIKDIIRYNNKLFVATNQGVFIYQKHIIDNNQTCFSNKKFYVLPTINFETSAFFKHNNKLYACTNKGLFSIDKNLKTENIIKDYRLLSCKQNNIDSNLFFLGTETGLINIKFEKNKVNTIYSVDTLYTVLRTFAQDKNIIWAGTDDVGIFKFKFNNSFSNAVITSINQGQGLPQNFEWVDVYNTSLGILYSTFKGVYKYNKKNGKFYKDTLFNKKDPNRWYYPIVEDSAHNIWYSSGQFKVFKKQTGVKIFNPKTKTYTDIHTPFNSISDLIIENIYIDKDSIVWLSMYDELIRVDVKKIHKAQTPKIYFKQIKFGKDSIEFKLFDTDSINYDLSVYHKLKYSLNNIIFSFSAIDFHSDGDIMYSWKLEGYDKEWSPWSKTNFKEYTNLWEKEYTFKVRAKGIFNNVSETISYSFKIKPPVYRMWYAYILYLILLATFIIMIIRYRAFLYAKEKYELERQIAEKTEEVVRQKEKAEMLIKKLLPEDTAKEIQMAGKAKRKKYEMVTVLFADIKGFTKIAEHMQSEMLLDELDRMFLKFDELIESKNIEKIKTIGDAYMCAGGIPRKNRTNAVDVVLVAMEMLRFVDQLRTEAMNDWQIRIGIHTGPVIAGVVGSKKLTYDIWGDTVNIASRMESSGKEGHINITEATYIYIEDFFECIHRGKIPVKYKGELDMYFVKGIKPEFSIDGKGEIPNEKFKLRYLQLKFRELEDEVYYKLENGLNKDIKYHDLKHTIDVVNQVEVIGKGEGVTDEEMLLLKTAALFHDFGFVLGYSDHEESGVKLAKEMLPNYGYSQEQIEKICELIYATKFPPNPENKLQEIICDADLDYLGRPDFLPVSIRLYEELFKFKQVKNIKEWNKIQVGFLEKHQYFTETARKMREVNKNKQLEQLKKWIEENS